MFSKLLLQLSVSILSIAGIAFALFRIGSFGQVENFEAQFAVASQRSGSVPRKALKPEEIQKQLNKLLGNWALDFKDRSRLAVLFAERAEKEVDPDKKLELLCKTLDSLSSALKLDPLRARTLVTWSNVRQLLGSYRCPNDKSESLEAALKLAQEADPLDQQALFNSGLVSLWAGKKEDAHLRFRRVLELGTDSSSIQREFIYSHVTDSESLTQLIPAKIPQAIEFFRYVSAAPKSSNQSKLSKKSLWEFQLAAIEEFSGRFERGEVPTDLFRDRLLELLSINRESPVISVLDSLLGQLYKIEGLEDLSVYFTSRSRLNEIAIVSSLRDSDSRPEKSALSSWGHSGQVSVDNFFASVGFFLPSGKTLRRIELQANKRSLQQLSGLLRILQSDDNASWEDVTGVCSIYQVTLSGKSVVYVEVPGSTKRFWKVHYASPGRNRDFSGSLSNMVRAYGIGALAE